MGNSDSSEVEKVEGKDIRGSSDSLEEVRDSLEGVRDNLEGVRDTLGILDILDIPGILDSCN